MSPYEVVFCFKKANYLDKLFAFANIYFILVFSKLPKLALLTFLYNSKLKEI